MKNRKFKIIEESFPKVNEDKFPKVAKLVRELKAHDIKAIFKIKL